MKGMGGAMRNIKGFVDGRNSAADATAAAEVIAAAAPKIAAVFPPNTGMGANPKSEAKDNIWKEWDAFTAAAKLLGDKAAALKTALASGNKGAAAAAFGDLGKNGCGGCHRQFRQKAELKARVGPAQNALWASSIPPTTIATAIARTRIARPSPAIRGSPNPAGTGPRPVTIAPVRFFALVDQVKQDCGEMQSDQAQQDVDDDRMQPGRLAREIVTHQER